MPRDIRAIAVGGGRRIKAANKRLKMKLVTGKTEFDVNWVNRTKLKSNSQFEGLNSRKFPTESNWQIYTAYIEWPMLI